MFDALQSTVDSGVLLVFYVTLCLGAGLWFLVTAVFGGAADAVSDAIDGLDGIDGDMDGDGGSVVSLRTILLFCVGFGGAGAIAVSLGAGLWVSVLSGVVGGLLVAGTGLQVFRMLRRQEATTNYSSDLLEGGVGTVTLAIKPGGLPGEISAIDNRGAHVRLRATAAKEVAEPLTEGTNVAIRAIHGGSAVVVPLDE